MPRTATLHRGARWRGATVGGLARAFPVSTFFVMAYLLSWAYWLVVLGGMGRSTLAWFVPGAFGPPVAALFVTGLVDGRAGVRAFLRRLVQWRVAPRWYVVAIVGLPALGVAVGCPFGTGRRGSPGPAQPCW